MGLFSSDEEKIRKFMDKSTSSESGSSEMWNYALKALRIADSNPAEWNTYLRVSGNTDEILRVADIFLGSSKSEINTDSSRESKRNIANKFYRAAYMAIKSTDDKLTIAKLAIADCSPYFLDGREIVDLLLSLARDGDEWGKRKFVLSYLLLSFVENPPCSLSTEDAEYGFALAGEVSSSLIKSFAEYRQLLLRDRRYVDDFNEACFILSSLGQLDVKKRNYPRAAQLLGLVREHDQILIDVFGSDSRFNFTDYIFVLAPFWTHRIDVKSNCYISDDDFVNIQYMAGLCLEKGEGVIQNSKEATYYYELAAKAGNADAQAALGILLYQGLGVPKNEVGGRAWILKAAEQNNSRAVEFIAEHPEVKETGVKKITNYHAGGDIYHDVGVVAKDDAIVNRPVVGGMGETKFCIHCGTSLPEDARFCFKCGKEVI